MSPGSPGLDVLTSAVRRAGADRPGIIPAGAWKDHPRPHLVQAEDGSNGRLGDDGARDGGTTPVRSRSGEFQALQQATEIATIETQFPRCPRPVAAVPLQARADVLPLEGERRFAQARHPVGVVDGHGRGGGWRRGKHLLRQIEPPGRERQDTPVARPATCAQPQYGTADGVFQFAHIPRPRVAPQGVARGRIESQAAQAEAAAILFEEVAGQQQHVAFALTQCRDGDGKSLRRW